MFKRTAALIALVLCLAAVSCAGETAESSVPVAESSESVPALTVEEAASLLDRDATLTGIFINNDLASEQAARKLPVESGNPFHDYSAIEDLLAETYLPSGGTADFFAAWPGGGLEPSVSQSDGVTQVFYHIGSSYSDRVLPDSIGVAEESETECFITGRTAEGESVKLKCVYYGGAWLLETGLYRSRPAESLFCPLRFPGAGIGSFAAYSGKILAVELFITDDESDPENDMTAQFEKNISAALDYLSSQAANYGGAVEVDLKRLYFNHRGTLGTGAYDLDIMFASTGVESIERLVKTEFEVDSYDSYVVFVCLDKDIPLSAKRYESTSETSVYFAERVVMSPAATPSEIALGLLGLLGAYDYDGVYCGEYLRDLFAAYFPDEFLLTKDISTGVISFVTAFECGMTTDLPPIYRGFYYEIKG